MTPDDRRPRRPPPADVHVLALDIGGTKLAAGVVTGDGRVLSRAVIPSHAEDGPWSMIDRHVDLGRQVVDEAGVPWSQLTGIGIACGGPLDPAGGIILSPPNLPGWDRIPLTDAMTERLGLPAIVENDATAGALAEWWYGAGRSRDVNDLVYLTISTGIGGGLVLDGRLYRGVAGNAGELGHLTVIYDGRQCGCGRRGCLEAYASGTNIAARAGEAIAAGGTSDLTALPRITAKDVAEHAASGDVLAGRIWDETTAMLGSAVANILDAFNPALVVLGGGVTRAGDQLLIPVREAGLRQAMEPARRSAEIVLAELGPIHDVVSAAVVAFDRLPVPSAATPDLEEARS
jgi:glucokinase